MRKRPIPLIISGAPRSGTTFFTASLNAHPQVRVSNELRLWSLFNDIRRRTEAPTELLPEHPLRDRFRTQLLAQFATFFRDFYETQADEALLGCPSAADGSPLKVVGDKNPGYADSHSKGCLEFIAEALPDARFIHVHRDPRSCVASYNRIENFSFSVGRGAKIWGRHVSNMLAFEEVIGEKRVMRVRYEDWVTPQSSQIMRRIEAFLSLPRTGHVEAFLAHERQAPTPYRAPATDTDKLGRTTFSEVFERDQIMRIEDACADWMETLGYAPEAV